MQMLFLFYKYQIFIGNPLTDIHADDTDTMKWVSYAYKVKMVIQKSFLCAIEIKKFTNERSLVVLL